MFQNVYATPSLSSVPRPGAFYDLATEDAFAGFGAALAPPVAPGILDKAKDNWVLLVGALVTGLALGGAGGFFVGQATKKK